MDKLHTHYDNLKVARDAPPEVIRAAYRSLCHTFHPDRHGGSAKATQTFQLINSAYDVVSDPARRQQHDEWIAREEAQALAAAPSGPLGWNGRERRRRHGSLPLLLARLGARLRHAGGSAMLLWTSAAAISALLFALYHA